PPTGDRVRRPAHRGLRKAGNRPVGGSLGGRGRGHVNLCPLRRRSRGAQALRPCADTVAPAVSAYANRREAAAYLRNWGYVSLTSNSTLHILRAPWCHEQ